MKRFDRVVELLDEVVGGSDAPVAVHGAFWRGTDLESFVELKVFGLQLITVGRGAESNLVKALKGEPPFGADAGQADAMFNRMPSGKEPASPHDIEFIERWIDDGCPDEDAPDEERRARTATTRSERRRASGSIRQGRVPDWYAWRPKAKSIAECMAKEAKRDICWLQDALLQAARLELATLPPYLTARWTIEDPGDPVAESIAEIRYEEMLHFGHACNLLVAVGGTPWIANSKFVPTYPDSLPGDVRPGLSVALRKLDRAQAAIFMEIEMPRAPIGTAVVHDTIGAFYGEILEVFRREKPSLEQERQVAVDQLKMVKSLDDVEELIGLINRQGEGATGSPEEGPKDLAHYYRFGEIYEGKRFVRDESGKWGYVGAPLPMPKTHDMADVPGGGYVPDKVPDPAVRDLITDFDEQYSGMLRELEAMWTHGNAATYWKAFAKMTEMGRIARELVTRPRPDGAGNYGPCFRYVPRST